MGIFNRAIPNIQTNNLNQVRVTPYEEYYVDDIFDPLFNAKVKEQLRLKYGNPIDATIGGYLEGIDNALLGQDGKWGILGSGMGILSGFGRSMDKAGDFIIGGVTEGIKGLTGQGFENPIRNIFVEDEDYTGTRLLAAMGNSMAGLAKAPRLDESDFKGLWNIPATGLELATDPGILGGQLVKASSKINLANQVAGQTANSTLADAGQLLMDYDDFMAKVSMDLTAPGLRIGAKTLLNKIQQKLGNSSAKGWAKVVLDPNESPEARAQAQKLLREDSEVNNLINMADEVSKADEMISQAELTNSVNNTDLNTVQAAVAAATTVPNAVNEQFQLSDEALRDLDNLLPYDRNIADWILSQEEINNIEYDYILKAFNSNIDELIAANSSDNKFLGNLEQAIRKSNQLDVELQSKAVSDFLDSDWAKKNLTVRNPNMYAHVPDDFNLDEMDVLSTTARNDDVANSARADFYNAIHDLAKKQHGRYALRSSEGISRISPEYLENVLPKELAEKTPQEAPDIYELYVNRLNLGYDMHNESARNSVLTQLGIDPKSRRAAFIENTPITLSPSHFAGRSATTLKLQMQYASKVLSNFTTKYDVNSLLKNPNFKRAFPEYSDREAIVELFNELGNPSLKGNEYLSKIRELSDLILDRQRWLPESFDNDPLNLKALKEANPDLDLTKELSFDRMYLTVAHKTLPTASPDYLQNLHAAIQNLEAEGIGFKKLKTIIDVPYSEIKSRDVSKYRLVKRTGLTKQDVDNYTAILDKYKQMQTLSADAYSRDLDLPNNLLLEDLTDTAELLQRNVIQTYDRREGAVRSINNLPRFEKGANDDLLGDAEESFANFDRGEHKDGTGKYRNRSINDLSGYLPHHSVLNNIIRLNKESFKNPEALAELKKYLGSSYEIKVRTDDGTFENLSTHIINSYKKEVLPYLEATLNEGYTPFINTKKTVLPEKSAGYKLQSILGRVPGVEGSPYASAYWFITKNIIKDSDVFNSAGKFADSFSAKFDFSKDIPQYVRNDIVSELASYGVKNPQAVIDKFISGKALTTKEFRALNTALQNTTHVPYVAVKNPAAFTDVFDKQYLQNFKDTLKDLKLKVARAAKGMSEVVVELPGGYLKTYSVKGKSEQAILRRILKDTEFFPSTMTPEFTQVVRTIPEFKYASDLDIDRVIDYFVAHPDELTLYKFSHHVYNFPSVIPGYFQLRQRPLTKKGDQYLGYIDYSSLYGNRQGDLWSSLTNAIETNSPYTPNIVFGAPDTKSKLQEALTNIKTSSKVDIADSVTDIIKNAPSNEAAEAIAEFPTLADEISASLAKELDIPEDALKQNPPTPPSDPEIPSSEPRKPSKDTLYSKNARTTLDIVNEAVAVRSKAASGKLSDRASVRTPFVKRIIDNAHLLMSRHKISVDDIRKYKNAQIYLSGARISKNEFLDTIASSGGMSLMAFKPSDRYEDILKAVRYNVSQINADVGANVLQVLQYKLPNGNTVIGYAWDTSNRKILNILDKNYKKINFSKLQDIVRLEEGAVSESVAAYLASDKYRKIDAMFNDVRQQESEYARLLGFKYEDTRHVKNVKRTNADVGNYFDNILYKDLPITDLEDISNKVINLQSFKHLRGSWGSRKFDRRFLGQIEDFEADGLRLFEDDAVRIVQGSLAEGSFNNAMFQQYLDLFENDNFKIKQYASKPEDLERILYANLDDGSESGNLQNFVLAAPRKDATGRVIGFTQFDKTTRAGLQAALNNSDTIMIPAHVLAPLDRILRKDAKMSNKVYTWLNKHLTLPFKFGVLMNPGFLIGNASDAYLKQATTMAHKYGTSVSEELANVAVAIRDVMVLNNKFDDAYRKFLVHIQTEGFATAPSYNISELAATDPRIRKMLKDYVSDRLKKSPNSHITPCALSKDERDTVKLWLTLNTAGAATFDTGFQDLEVLAKAKNSSKYNEPKTVVERILMGRGEYMASDVSTWGVVVNNPISRAFMNSSENIENTFRAASILNDFRHKGMNDKWFSQYFRDLSELKQAAKKSARSQQMYDDLKKKFNVSLSEGINTMHNANFDYERMTDFTDTVGTFIPFPTFFLKNLGYWLDVLVNHPQYIDHAITVQEGAWGSRDTSKDKFAAEAKGRGAVPIAVGGQNLSNFFKGIYKPTPLQSMFGAFSLINNPVEDVYYRLHPLLSGGLTAASKVEPIKSIAADAIPNESVKYRPYSTDMYERNITRDDPKFNPLAYAVHRMNPVERTVQTALRIPDKLKHNQAQLSDFSPSIFQPDFGEKYSK
jgi:hypothetical protein